MNARCWETEARNETRRLIGHACDRFKLAMPSPEIRFDLRGKSAGMVVFPPQDAAFIRYNRQMLFDNGEAFIEQTIPHEVAHLVARRLHGAGIRPHGKEWQSIMSLFGAEAVRCHNFTVSGGNRRRMRHYPYRCSCREHSLSAIRHHRWLAGVAYLCRRCGSPLNWLGPQTN